MRLLTAILFCGCLSGQTPAGPKFDAASIKPVPAPESGRPRLTQNASGINFPVIWLHDLVSRAWKLYDYELSFPDGFRQRWSVSARAPENSTLDQIPTMLQNLLIERFQLRFHRETREIPAYVLVPAKGGPKLRATESPRRRIGLCPLAGRRSQMREHDARYPGFRDVVGHDQHASHQSDGINGSL